MRIDYCKAEILSQVFQFCKEKWKQIILIGALWTVWFCVTSLLQKRNALFAGVSFTVMESIFTKITTGKPHTTFAQFWAMVLIFPFVSERFRVILQFGLYPLEWLMKVVLFPFNAWVMEIIQGYLLTWYYGKNVAWNYSDENLLCDISSESGIAAYCTKCVIWNAWRTGKDSFFHGNIKLGYYPLWCAVGIIHEIAFVCMETVDRSLSNFSLLSSLVIIGNTLGST